MSLNHQASARREHCAQNGPALFQLGCIRATPGALDLLDRTGTTAALFLDRHQRGDFGTVGAQDAQANKDAIEDGERILSSFNLGSARLWVITEGDRACTTLLLPEEY
ncbi:hypothetical protein NRS07_19310 (plasmid) [Massilia sp. H6]|jgi:hypothetical protein|nr:hypothetical protein NRS07_19310 [Massilia sp. H6]